MRPLSPQFRPYGWALSARDIAARAGIAAEDVLLFGRESAGVPQEVHQAADARLVIPMRSGMRSLNVAVAAAMAAGEALRQLENAG